MRNTMPEETIDTLYSVTAAAQKLGGISKFTIYSWLSRGLLERTKVGGRTMIRESSLQRFIKRSSNKQPARTGGRRSPVSKKRKVANEVREHE
jgi:excisionase family DNA binding protein